MIKLDYADPKNVEKTLADMRNLIDHQGWLLVKAIAYANMEFLKEQIITGVEDETPETISRLRDKLKAYKDIIETPDKVIEQLSPKPNLTENNDDPYDIVDDSGKLV